MLPQAGDQRHVPEAVGRGLRLLRAHQVHGPRLTPGVLNFKAGRWPRYNVVRRGRRAVSQSRHGDASGVALALLYLLAVLLLEANLDVSEKRSIHIVVHALIFTETFLAVTVTKLTQEFPAALVSFDRSIRRFFGVSFALRSSLALSLF